MGEQMTIEDLDIALAKIVEEDLEVRNLDARLKEAEIRFENESRKRIVGEEFLSRAYCL